jgi:hypothetical protein
MENVGRLDGAVFGKGVRPIRDVLATLQGRILQP